MTTHIDGDTPRGTALRATARRIAASRNYDTRSRRALGDYYAHHITGTDHSSLNLDGMCVGCWWCCGPLTQAHKDVMLPRKASDG